VNVLWIRNWHCDTLLHMCQADTACALTGWQHVSAQNDIVAATLNV